MHLNDKDAGAYLTFVSGGGARGVAAGTGDNTEFVGDIVDAQAQPGLRSGAIVVSGSAVLADTESISILDVKIEHGDESDLSDKANFTALTDFADVKTSSGGTTELFTVKVNVNVEGCKRYWRVAATPDLSASGTDTFQVGICAAMVGESAPLT